MILFITDHPGLNTGVANVSRDISDASDFEFKFIGGNCAGGDPPSAPSCEVISAHTDYGNRQDLFGVVSKNSYNLEACLVMGDPHRFDHVYKASPMIRSKVPLIYYHVWDSEKPDPTFNKPIYDCFDRIISASVQTQKAVQSLGIDNSPLVHHGVKTSVFRDLGDVELSFGNPNWTTLLFVGTNQRRKNIGQLIEAFAKFKRELPESQFVLKTEREGFFNIDRIAEYRGVSEDVYVVNSRLSRKDMAHMYNAADVTINVSHREGFGLTPLESVSCGTPAVVSGVGGHLDQKIGTHVVQPSHTHVAHDSRGAMVEESYFKTQDIVHEIKCALKSNMISTSATHNQMKERGMAVESMTKNMDREISNVIETFRPVQPFFVDAI